MRKKIKFDKILEDWQLFLFQFNGAPDSGDGVSSWTTITADVTNGNVANRCTVAYSASESTGSVAANKATNADSAKNAFANNFKSRE